MRAEFFNALSLFAQHFAVGLALTAAFVALYARLTPHKEIALVRAGNAAAALGLIGATVGFVLPLSLVFSVTPDPLEAALWGAVALAAQAGAHAASWRLLPELRQQIEDGQVSGGIIQAGVGVVVGLVSAAALTP